MLLFKCRIKQVKEIKDMTKSNYNSWKNFKAIPYTKQEREENAEAERIEQMQAEEIDQALLSWAAGNGSKISVQYSRSGDGFDVIVDGTLHANCQMVPAPEKYQEPGPSGNSRAVCHQR